MYPLPLLCIPFPYFAVYPLPFYVLPSFSVLWRPFVLPMRRSNVSLSKLLLAFRLRLKSGRFP